MNRFSLKQADFPHQFDLFDFKHKDVRFFFSLRKSHSLFRWPIFGWNSVLEWHLLADRCPTSIPAVARNGLLLVKDVKGIRIFVSMYFSQLNKEMH